MSYLQADWILSEWIDVTWETAPFSFCVEPAGYLALPPTVTINNRAVVSALRPDPTLNTDDPTQVFRSYSIINAGTLNPTEAQWQSLIAAAKLQPFCAGIIAMARATQNFLSANIRSLGTGNVLKNTLAVFEVAAANKDTALALLDARALADGRQGNIPTELAGVLQFEIRAAAVALGYTQTAANKLTVSLINTTGQFDRDTANATAKAYLAANSAIWFAPA